MCAVVLGARAVVLASGEAPCCGTTIGAEHFGHLPRRPAAASGAENLAPHVHWTGMGMAFTDV